MRITKAVAAVAAIGITSLSVVALQAGSSGAAGVIARAELRDQGGVVVGEVVFKKLEGEIVGQAEVQLPAGSAEFHGFHLHANDVDSHPVDGNAADGCIGDFSSVDGHWKVGNQVHGEHAGDLPVLMRDGAGHAAATFTIGKFAPADIIGRAVVVHVGPDNYANVPTRYVSPTSPVGGGADPTTLANGDAGGRFACGVVEPRSG